jgi:hypothetical protein
MVFNATERRQFPLDTNRRLLLALWTVPAPSVYSMRCEIRCDRLSLTTPLFVRSASGIGALSGAASRKENVSAQIPIYLTPDIGFSDENST